MSDAYQSISLDQLLIGQPLPCNLYIYIDSRYITFRAHGDVIDQNTFDRLQFKNVAHLFILEKDSSKFDEWAGKEPSPAAGPPCAAENQPFLSAWKDAHRKTLDIFQSPHPEQAIHVVLKSSKKLVAEVMKFPFATKSLDQIQVFSRGTVDHSVNVGVLSVYLAMQMGYSHQLILQNVAVGGLLHDLGKRKVDILDTDSQDVAETKMREHPLFGMQMLDAMENVPNEVKLIVAQHHELHDGTGYPKKLRASNIYDLARIVTIANVFDHLVADGEGSLAERQKAAIESLDHQYFNRIEPDKHEKAIRILQLGI